MEQYECVFANDFIPEFGKADHPTFSQVLFLLKQFDFDRLVRVSPVYQTLTSKTQTKRVSPEELRTGDGGGEVSGNEAQSWKRRRRSLVLNGTVEHKILDP